jgi:hypothetical protein
MIENWLQNWCFTAVTKWSDRRIQFWFRLSLAAAILCGSLALVYAFRGDYIVDADARQHVFWMQRFANPNLFPQDWITDYHQSVSPIGYTAVYRSAQAIGIAPFTFNKLLPLILGTIATGYAFCVSLALLPLPVAGFLSTLLLNQTLWMRYDLVSGTARSFAYPLFLAFLYYCLRQRRSLILVTLALQGLFYPQILFVSLGTLLLTVLLGQRGDRGAIGFCLAAIMVTGLVMLPYALRSSEFGPAITAAAARLQPEFLPGGRTRFFHENLWEYWLYGKRSGVLPQLEMAPLVLAGLTLPLLLRWRDRFPLSRQVNQQMRLLACSLVASIGMFLLAHALLFKLHLPSRYTMHSLVMVLPIAAGMALVILSERVNAWLGQRSTSRRSLIIPALLVIALVVYPFFTGFPYTKYKRGEAVALYQFLVAQPQDSLIASLADEADNLPSFAQRSVLVSDMYAIPYHIGYYDEIRRRTQALIQAQYSPDIAAVRSFIRQYGIDFWLIDTQAFTLEYLSNNTWLRQYPNTQAAIAQLQAGTQPAIRRLQPRCTVVNLPELQLLDARCLESTMP